MKRFALGLLFALWSSIALAQGCGPQNPNCIVPTAPPGTSNNQAASTAFVNGGGIAANVTTPPAATFTITPSSPFAASVLGYTPLGVMIRKPSDNAAETGILMTGQQLPALLYVEDNIGGSNINTGRDTLVSFLNFTAPTSATNPFRFYVATNFYANAVTGDNGTMGAPAGVLEASTVQIQLQNGATFWLAMLGQEISVSANTGSSVSQKAALLLDEWPSNKVHGSVVDAWIWTYGFTGGVGMNTWSQIDANGGQFALSSAATVIKLVSAYTIATGFDFGTGTVTGNVLQWASSVYSLAGNGTATLGNLLFPSGLVSVGTCTGIGSTGSCAMATGSSRQRGKVILTSAGTGQSTAGALTLTFTGALGADDSSCVFFPQNGSGAWASATTMQGQASSSTTATVIWISAVAPVAGNNYLVEYSCGGI
jgi:hypothetical protein